MLLDSNSNMSRYSSSGYIPVSICPHLIKLKSNYALQLQFQNLHPFPVLEAVEKAAESYTKRNLKPPVLIIDNVERLAQNSPSVLATLQDFAKDHADKHDLTIVFVSGESSASRSLLDGRRFLFEMAANKYNRVSRQQYPRGWRSERSRSAHLSS